LGLGACDGADSPLAPATEPATSEAVASDAALAVTTWQRIVFTSYRYGGQSDGSRLVLSLGIGGVSYVGWMDVATGQVGLFNAAGGGYQGTKPSYDPTGKQIAYSSAGDRGVDHITADGSIHLVYVSCLTLCSHPTYSPDGKKIAFDQVVGNNDREIFVKNLVTSVTTRLTTSAGTDMAPT
jgi:Tol biopolymer transport system component